MIGENEILIKNNRVYIKKDITDKLKENIIESVTIAKNYKLHSTATSNWSKEDEVEGGQYRPFQCFVCGSSLKYAEVYKHIKNNTTIHVGSECHKRIIHYQMLIRKYLNR